MADQKINPRLDILSGESSRRVGRWSHRMRTHVVGGLEQTGELGCIRDWVWRSWCGDEGWIETDLIRMGGVW